MARKKGKFGRLTLLKGRILHESFGDDEGKPTIIKFEEIEEIRFLTRDSRSLNWNYRCYWVKLEIHLINKLIYHEECELDYGALAEEVEGIVKLYLDLNGNLEKFWSKNKEPELS